VLEKLPGADYDPVSRLVRYSQGELPHPAKEGPYCMVVSGGTSDMPVAEEAAQTLEFLGSRVIRAYDVGVSGVHRLLDQRELLARADVIISVAGMEGALTSVVGGLVSCPVVGVPTSVGYGANFGGISALLAMLNACAPGIAVVNIDNGFGAAVYAHSILRRITT
jgi:NCAIR mutase (PurE)-related protein